MAIACPIDLDTLKLRAETHRFDCFEAASKERTARRYGVIGVNLSAVRR